jgi:hypothetical protein
VHGINSPPWLVQPLLRPASIDTASYVLWIKTID